MVGGKKPDISGMYIMYLCDIQNWGSHLWDSLINMSILLGDEEKEKKRLLWRHPVTSCLENVKNSPNWKLLVNKYGLQLQSVHSFINHW